MVVLWGHGCHHGDQEDGEKEKMKRFDYDVFLLIGYLVCLRFFGYFGLLCLLLRMLK